MILRRTLLLVPVAALLRAAANPLFTFRVSFWLNLHHFLYVLGRIRNNDSQYARNPAAADTQGVEKLTELEQTSWEKSVAAYSASASTKDLVFDRSLARITKMLGETADDASPPEEAGASLREALRTACADLSPSLVAAPLQGKPRAHR